MNKEYKIKLDLNKKLYNKKMAFNQFDENVNDFYIEVTKNNEVVKDLDKSIVTLVAIKPDNTVDAQFIEVKEGQIYADLKPSMCDLVGNYQAKAMIVLEGEIVTTDTINYSVNEDKIISRLNDDVTSDERFTLFTDALARLSTIEISEEQRIVNEAERILAEENRKIEEAKRVEAELVRQHEEADRTKYDATRESNENIRKQNESIRLANETNRTDEEAKRVEEEAKRKLAEEERNANYNFMTEDEERRRAEANAHKEAEVLRVQAETNRVNEEAKRRTTEQARVSAENTRVSNENTRKANEVTRQINETQRVEAETQRQNRYNSFISDAEANASNFENYTNNAKVKEEERKANELDRKSQEARRVSNETERISNENTRKANEVTRIESEKQRVDAENLRKEKIIEIQSDYDSLKKVIIDENASANLQNQINQTNSQLDTIETKKANQSAFNNLKNQINNLVIESGGDSNLEVIQSRVSNGFTHKSLDNRLLNLESIINNGKFNIEFFDLINNSISSTGEISASSNIRITTNSKYNISSLNEIYLRINKLDNNRISFAQYYYDENETLISSSLVTSSRSETDSYYEYKINVTNANYMRLLFKFEDDSEIYEDDIYENVSLYFYNEDRIYKINNELNEMCYDNLGNKFDSPSELIKDVTKIVAHTKNLFNKSSDGNVDGYINGAGGEVNTSSTYKTSYFIRGLQENEKYIITPRIRKFLAYDKDNKVITSSYVDANMTNYVFTMDSSWSAIRFTYYVSDEDKIMLSQGEEPQTYVDYGYIFGKNLSFNDYQREEIKGITGSQGNKLANKILFNFGDSIAAGNNGKGYAELFATKYGMVCHDFAVGGATLGETEEKNITTQVTTALSTGITPDYILIEGGTNDISSNYNIPIGSLTDNYDINSFDKSTTVGGLEWIIYTLKTEYPDAKIAFVSVHKMGSRGYSSQIERQGVCVDTCKKWSIPIIDIFNRGNLNTFLAEHHKFTNPTESKPNGDKTHPNELGYTTFYLPLIYETLYFI